MCVCVYVCMCVYMCVWQKQMGVCERKSGSAQECVCVITNGSVCEEEWQCLGCVQEQVTG